MCILQYYLTCVFYNVTRAKDGKDLVAGDRVAVTGSGDGIHSVTITKVTKADEGEYRLKAIKDDAFESTSAKLKIEGG